MKSETKQRVAIWMKPDLLETADRLVTTDDSKNRSEFICNAVSFYTGFLQSQNIEAYTNKTFLKEIDSRLARHQKSVCQTLFKLAVELGMNSHIIAASYENITPEYLVKLRKRCIKDVKKSLGMINFDSIYEYHTTHDISSEDEE
jgi:metal-responsive CopG/Arc/MetJ family transcriptional regulator